MTRVRPTTQGIPLGILLAAPLLTVACVGQGQKEDIRAEISHMISHRQFRAAVERARAIHTANPGDPVAEEMLRTSSVAYLLEKGRRLTFDNEDDEALAVFEEALAIHPDSKVVWAWRDKTRAKLSKIWYERARELHVNDENLAGALEAYRYALEYSPEFTLARQGAVQALIQMNYREGLSDDYYNEGVRALQGYGLELARSRFDYASKYRPGDERPVRRSTEVEALLSKERLAVANSLEEDGLYAAAANEFELALVMDPENEAAAVGRDRMQIEAEASRLMDEANMMILRGEWNRARMKLREGRDLTQRQVARFDDLLADIDDARIRSMYEQALDFEHDFQYAEAIEVYAEILSERGWYDDARSRIETLREYVEHARDLYERAAASADLATRKNLLQQIEIFWPEYRDVHDQLDALGEN